MERELIVDVSSSEINIALLENKRLVELHKDRSNVQFAVGDIYLGRVKKIMPGLNAAFIDVGFEKDAFLHYLDLGAQFKSLDKYVQLAISKKGKLPGFTKFRTLPDIDKEGKISDVLKTGQSVLVQIAKEPISSKGPRLTSEISIAGRNIVLMPFSDKVSISQKISSQQEKTRLKNLLQSIRPRNYGIIVRTVAEGKKVAELDSELRSLIKKWDTAVPGLAEARPPKLIVSELNRTSAILRDIFNVTFNKIHTNNERVFQETKEYISSIAPEKEKIVRLYQNPEPIFNHFGVNKQIKTSFGKTVSFKEGAYLIIEHTEALHVIDVNSGNRSKSYDNQETNALQVNLAAADEIARQLRLRDMGGIIVVDFIDMNSHDHKHKLFDKIKAAMDVDNTKHNILPLTKFGLMQITRQRVREEVKISTTETCPSCEGSGKISASVQFLDDLKEKVRIFISETSTKKFVLRVHPYIAAFMKQGFRSLIKRWNQEFKSKIKVVHDDSYTFFQYGFFSDQGDEIVF